jgi:subtilisin-like proprotein convertase family protein
MIILVIFDKSKMKLNMKKFFSCLLLFAICFSPMYLQAQTYTNTIGGFVPDDGTNTDFPISVSGLASSTLDSNLGVVSVCLNMNHTYDADLNFFLISPSGTFINLIRNVGGGGYNFVGTCLSQSASTSIASGIAPFTGSFTPTESLGNVNDGSNGNGIWILRIRDEAGADTGSLLDWNITFGDHAPIPFLFTSSNLPIVMINTLGQTIVDEPKINCSMKVIDNGFGFRNRTIDAPVYNGNIGIEIRGAYSSSLPQKPYGFTTQDISNNDSNTVLLGLPSEHDWILQATYNDKTFLRNIMMFDLFRKMGHYATRTKFCEVTLNGNYQGIYFLCEKIKRDANRVDIAKLDLDDNAGDSLTGGYIFKHDYDAAGWNSSWLPPLCPDRFLSYQYFYPNAATITLPQQDFIKAYVDSFEEVLFSDSFSSKVNGYKKYISTPSFVDYLISNELAQNGDGYKKSMFFHKDKTSKGGKLKAGPIWDFDWSLKFAPWVDADVTGWTYTAAPCDGDVLFTPWFARLMEDTTFENAVFCRWQELRQTIIDSAYLNHELDSMALVLDEAQARHFDAWGTLGAHVGSPESDPLPTTYAGEVDRLKLFLTKRIVWIDSNLNGHCYLADTVADTLVNTSIVIRNDIQKGIQVFPNPASESVHVNYQRTDLATLTVSNTTNVLMAKYILEKGQQVIDVSNYANGIYLLDFKNHVGETLYRQKIVVVR